MKLTTYTELKTKERDKRIKAYLENGPSNKLSAVQLRSLKAYYMDMVTASYSEETISSYLHKLKMFGEAIKKPYEQVTADDFKDFLMYLHDKKAKLNYVNGYKIVLRVFYKQLLGIKDNQDALFNPLKIKRAGPVKTASDCLSQEEIKTLLNSADNYRDRFLIHGLYESALRKSEFMSLKIRDVKIRANHSYAEIVSVNGKTGFRKMPIPLVTSFPDLVAMLNHHPHRDNPSSPLFIDLDHPNKGLGAYGLNDALRKYQLKAKLKKACYPHIFRHSRLTHLGEQGFTEMELRMFAGWSGSSPMAAHYVHSKGKYIRNKMLQSNGIKTDDTEQQSELKRELEPTKCPRCETLNSAGSMYCPTCGAILDLRAAIQLQEATQIKDKVIDKTIQKDQPLSRQLVKEIIKELVNSGEIVL